VSGILLARYGPRSVMVAGTAALSLGAILLAVAFCAFGHETASVWLRRGGRVPPHRAAGPATDGVRHAGRASASVRLRRVAHGQRERRGVGALPPAVASRAAGPRARFAGSWHMRRGLRSGR
jgi:MFS family permease